MIFQAHNALSDKQKQSATIDEFNAAVQSLNNYLGGTINKIELIDNDESLTCKQKVDQLDHIKVDFEEKSVDELNTIRIMVQPISNLVDSFDIKQLDDQVKSLERRQKEVSKRFERKLNMLNKAVENQGIIVQEVQDIQKWIHEKNSLLNKPSLLGFEVSDSEKQLQNLKVSKYIHISSEKY